MNKETLSTGLGLLTIGCWASLATLGYFLGHLPPFLVLGISFLLGSSLGFFRPRKMFPPWKILAWGVFGHFGYHFCLFYAFRFAPPLEANLINYLWPVILVLLTPLAFKDHTLKSYHYAGAVLSLLGVVLLVSGKGIFSQNELRGEYLTGYLFAFGAALVWPIYTIGKKKLPSASTWSMGSICFFTGILCLLVHYYLWPSSGVVEAKDYGKILFMGLGPCGVAFYAWDLSLKWGDPRSLGALSYLTPLLSTIGLILLTPEKLTTSTFGAMVFILLGASVGVLDFFQAKR